MVARGWVGHAWLLWGGVVAPGGGVHGCSGGMCVVALGGMHGCSGGIRGCSGGRGHAWLLQGCMRGCSWGACMVAPGGHVWLLPGGACMVAPRGGAWDMTRYGDTINGRAVHILLECILVLSNFDE